MNNNGKTHRYEHTDSARRDDRKVKAGKASRVARLEARSVSREMRYGATAFGGRA